MRVTTVSDCLIFLGTFMTDVNLGVFTAHIEQGRLILATSEKLFIRHHSYEGLTIESFVQGLLTQNIRRHDIFYKNKVSGLLAVTKDGDCLPLLDSVEEY